MQFLEFLTLLKKHGLSYAIFGIYFPYPKSWTTICNLWKFFLFSKLVDYHMPFLKLFHFSQNVEYHMQFMVFLSLLQKHGLSYEISEISFSYSKRGLSYAIYGICFPSTKTWTIICNF